MHMIQTQYSAAPAARARARAIRAGTRAGMILTSPVIFRHCEFLFLQFINAAGRPAGSQNPIDG